MLLHKQEALRHNFFSCCTFSCSTMHEQYIEHSVNLALLRENDYNVEQLAVLGVKSVT